MPRYTYVVKIGKDTVHLDIQHRDLKLKILREFERYRLDLCDIIPEFSLDMKPVAIDPWTIMFSLKNKTAADLGVSQETYEAVVYVISSLLTPTSLQARFKAIDASK